MLIDGLYSQPEKTVQGPPGPPGPEGPRGPAGENGRDGRDVSISPSSSRVAVLFQSNFQLS